MSSIPRRGTTNSIVPVSAAAGTPSLRPVVTITSTLAHATLAPSALLALPRTLTQPVVSITRTDTIFGSTLAGLTRTTTGLTQAAVGATSRVGSILSPTLAELTDTTRALTQAAGTISAPALDVSLGALARTVEAGIPTESSATAFEPGTGADRVPTVASAAAPPAPLLGGVVRDLVLDGMAQVAPASPGPSSASWLALAADVVPQPAGPGAPVPGNPVAPATPAGVTVGSGVNALTGVLVDSMAFPATLTVLVLIACARRWAWWFPEVAIGPD
jgi:hypothetical protein